MELTIEVVFAVLALVAWGSSEAAELFFSPLLAKIGATDKDVRKGVFIAGMFIVNALFIYFTDDMDIIAGLLEQNSTLVTVALSAFAASGVGEIFHKFKGRVGRPKSLGELLIDTGEIINEE